jgi:hypothetical protein
VIESRAHIICHTLAIKCASIGATGAELVLQQQQSDALPQLLELPQGYVRTAAHVQQL